MLSSLSGRFLILTVAYVMLAEALIFVPSVAQFRKDYLLDRLERAQIASLALLAEEDINQGLEQELLTNAGVYNVVLQRDDVRELVLSSPMREPISTTFDIRDVSTPVLIFDALHAIFDRRDRILRVIGTPSEEAGQQIEITLPSAPMRRELLTYGRNILGISVLISLITGALLFFAMNRLIVGPVRRLSTTMDDYARAPEDARRVIDPRSGVLEICEAEQALKMMQLELTANLRHKERLATIGEGVAKINHDMRNILTSAQLFSDRMESSEDPTVKRLYPKLVRAISRAVRLCEATLRFSSTNEPKPTISRISLAQAVADVFEAERLVAASTPIQFTNHVEDTLYLHADPEQLYRILLNLVRNARQAITTQDRPGEIRIYASESDHVCKINVSDTGPGIAKASQAHLFTPFQGGTSGEGWGLGLSIAAELVHGHAGKLKLLSTGVEGTIFQITLPKVDAEPPK